MPKGHGTDLPEHESSHPPLQGDGRTVADKLPGGSALLYPLNVLAVERVGLAVFHDARHFREEVFVVAGAAQQMEPHLHPGGDPPCSDDAPGIHDARG